MTRTVLQNYNSVEDDLKGVRVKGRRYLRVQKNGKMVRCDNALKYTNGSRGGGEGIPMKERTTLRK